MQNILKLKSIYLSKIWGGRNLETIFHRQLNSTQKIGEAWEVSDFENEISVIENGILKGQNLQDCIKMYSQELLGIKDSRFPLLVKIIDASDNLSVQVHPDETYVLEKDPRASSKIEAWYVLSAAPNSKIFCGFSQKLTKEKFREIVMEQRAEDFLNSYTVQKGDAFLIPPGTIHAIGKGCMILEIQQASDTTYRVYDYGRLDEKGNPRELHLEKSLDVLDFSASNGKEKLTYLPIPNDKIEKYLITDNYKFRIEYWIIHKDFKIEEFLNENKAIIITVLDGEIVAKQEKLSFKAGDSFIVTIPGIKLETFIPAGTIQLLVSFFN